MSLGSKSPEAKLDLKIVMWAVGSKFSDFFRSPEKFGDMVVNNLMH